MEGGARWEGERGRRGKSEAAGRAGSVFKRLLPKLFHIINITLKALRYIVFFCTLQITK